MKRVDLRGLPRGSLWLLLWLTAGWMACGARGGTVCPPYEARSPATPESPIDPLVRAAWAQRDVAPANPCSDAVFLRRVYLDVLGTLPTAAEAQDFLADRHPTKRRALIDRLLERPEFADYWAMKWSDLLRIKAEFPINLWPNAAQAYHHWVRDALRTNMPYSGFARELLTASGSNFQHPPVNFYRALPSKTPVGLARAVALTFLGVRAERWPSNELANLALFFAQVSYKSTSEWKEEIVFFNPASTNLATPVNGPRTAVFPDGTSVVLEPDQDPRFVFADWLVSPKNPGFARCFANRVWSWLMGRGIVNEPDDLRPDNPPSHPELLALLERELIDSGYDFKRLLRTILNSQTYQLSSIPASSRAADWFACYPVRRLEAEVLIDAINQIAGAKERYSSPIPEPYTVIPDNLRSIALPDGSISSPFLELFGRSARDTGRESERNNQLTAGQKLWLLNSSQMRRKVEQSRMVEFQSRPNRPPAQVATGMYLGILSRYPTPEEMNCARAILDRPAAGRREAVADLAWALMNTVEFLFRH